MLRSHVQGVIPDQKVKIVFCHRITYSAVDLELSLIIAAKKKKPVKSTCLDAVVNLFHLFTDYCTYVCLTQTAGLIGCQ